MSEYPAGSTAKVYFDIDGNETTLHRLVRSEPEWAASRIIEGEKASENIEQLQRENAALRKICIDVYLDQYVGQLNDVTDSVDRAWKLGQGFYRETKDDE